MAARTLLLKLERAGHLRLPARRGPSPNGCRNRQIEPIAQPDEPIGGALRDLQPLRASIVAPGSDDARLLLGLLAHEHYLGQRHTVGENLRYHVRDRHGRTVACVLFGSAAWKCADGDAFNMAKRFRENGKAYFEFITTPDVSPTNNLAEQAVRFVVIDRRCTTRWCSGSTGCWS